MSTNAEPIEVEETALLCDLNDKQLEHVSLGLTHAFGATLTERTTDDPCFLVLESGRLVALHERTLTVLDVWKTAEALTA